MSFRDFAAESDPDRNWQFRRRWSERSGLPTPEAIGRAWELWRKRRESQSVLLAWRADDGAAR